MCVPCYLHLNQFSILILLKWLSKKENVSISVKKILHQNLISLQLNYCLINVGDYFFLTFIDHCTIVQTNIKLC